MRTVAEKSKAALLPLHVTEVQNKDLSALSITNASFAPRCMQR